MIPRSDADQFGEDQRTMAASFTSERKTMSSEANSVLEGMDRSVLRILPADELDLGQTIQPEYL